MGPGLGHAAVDLARRVAGFDIPMVVDADALTSDLGRPWPAVAILTPHPGEMARLTGMSTADVQKDRIGVARAYAQKHRVTLVLKGQRTVIAFPDGRVWINPTGTPALGTGGAGDILTGLITGLLAQFPDRADEVVAAAVYLGGLAAEIAVRDLGEKSLIATDLLRYLPKAIAECQG
jgi:ADP-dependent NAD(P)H-hydrate dehydratase / NAD(P)H-hydrate epimerase